MVQKEVAHRICANPGSPEYGAFTVYTRYHTIPEKMFDVPPECFAPRPKVTSTVVKMVTKSGLLPDMTREKALFRTVRAAFGQRRKTLVNALYSEYNKSHNKEEITAAVIKCGFNKNIRGEMLSVEDFKKLSSFLAK